MVSGSELQVNPEMEALMDAPGPSTNIETTGECIGSEAKPMQCVSNCEDSVFDMETSVDVVQKGELNDENVEVDIINDDKDIADILQIKELVAGQDSTENSSSFSGTFSGSENASALSDGEVDSQNLDGNMPGFYFPGFYEGFTPRKKRLTDHWIRFIHPLKWRCRWLELQIKEFQSRALEYDKELEQYEERKQHLFENSGSEDFNSRSLAFSGQLPIKHAMKRRKRKRIEETVDIASYMTNHNLFSYYDKRITADRSLTKDGNGNQAISNGIPSLGGDNLLHLKDGDNSMEQILEKIVIVQSQVHQLKTRIEKLITENPGKFSSVNMLSMAISGSAGNVSDEEPPSPAANGQFSSVKSLYAASQLVSDGDAADMLLPNQPITEHLAISTLPDVVESTKQVKDGSLINNRAAEEGLPNSKEVGDEQNKKPVRQFGRRKKVASSAVVSEAALPVETPSPLETSNVKSHPSLKTYISKNKRKRRRRAPARKKTKRLSG